MRFEKLVFDFIWDGKRDKVKRSVVINNFEDGGLKVRDIKAHIDMLRISWIKRLICYKNNEDSWTQIPKLYFNKFGENLLVFKMNIRDMRRLPGILNIPEFYSRY